MSFSLESHGKRQMLAKMLWNLACGTPKVHVHRVNTDPGNPWKIPGIFFLLSPGKSHRTLLKKQICEVVHFVDFITSNY